MSWALLLALTLSLTIFMSSPHLIMKAIAVKLCFDCLGVLLLSGAEKSLDLQVLALLTILTGSVGAISLIFVSHERANRAGRGTPE